MKLYDIATVIRSKNAGPFTLTIDVMFDDRGDLARVLAAPALGSAAIAALYAVPPASVSVHVLEQALAIKVTLPRATASGAVGDRDVYGSQQHFPLATVDIP